MPLKLSLIFIFSSALWLNCSLFENEQASIFECTETDLSNAVLHAGVNKNPFSDSHIAAYNPETLELLYRTEIPLGAPLDIFYSQNNHFFYSIGVNSEASAIMHRSVQDGAFIDSIPAPESNYVRLNDSTFVTQIFGFGFMVINGKVKREGFSDHIIQAVQEVNGEFYAIYGDIDNVYFGKVDTTGLTLKKDLTGLIQSTIRNGVAYSLQYNPDKKQLLVMMENVPQSPNSVLFDIDLSTDEFTATAAGQNGRIIASNDPRYFLITHRSSFSLNQKAAKHLFAYDKLAKKLIRIINFDKEFGMQAYVQDISTNGCNIFAGLLLVDSELNQSAAIFNYDMKTGEIRNKITFKDFFSITTLDLSLNNY